jgi:hypothetical protein
MAEAIFYGTHSDALNMALDARTKGKTDIYNGALQCVLGCADAMREAMDKATAEGKGTYSLADGATGADAEFLRKSQNMMAAEFQTADDAGVAWRLRALTEALAVTHRACIRKISVVDTFPTKTTAKAEPMPVQVVSMPDRVSVQSVERDNEGEITSTTTVQKDYAA